ncbi:MAG: tRNA lysidine(34) synthetase TilS [Dehalococcoidales bacterium]|nr:tRNA lysidine(34) synthetase TilS [Dehalococcoidales bacterium]
MTPKPEKLALEQRVLRFIRDNRLLTGGQKVLAAVSGGADSVCLLHILYRLREELNISLYAAHFNHQLRGADSDADAVYVADLAQKLDIPLTTEKGDVAGFQAEHRLSLEEAARELRYRFLSRTAGAIGVDRVATGHTRNDQIETILLHIIRGTGLRGLRGLQSCQALKFEGRSLTVIRPLLEIRREETEACCSELELTPCLDSSNLSFSLLRNRVRHELLPLLQSYNPGVGESLLRTARIARDDLAFLESEGDKAWQEVASRKGNTVFFDKARFKNLSPALRRQMLRKAIDGLLGTLKDIEVRHIEEVLEALGKPAGKQIILPEGLVFGIEYRRYLLGFALDESVPLPELKGSYRIKIPGKTEVPGWEIEAEIKARASLEDIPPDWMGMGEVELTACFDLENTGPVIQVGANRGDDLFQPLGMDSLKKVRDFMADARVPKAWRDRVPILSTPRQIIWVAGWRIDERVKLASQTLNVLLLKMRRKPV